MDVKLLSFTFSAFLLGGVFVGANASGCADIEKVKTAIGDISDFYGDVRPSVDCQRQIGRIDKLVCGDDELRLIEQLDTKAWVYAGCATRRNATQRPARPEADAMLGCTLSDCISGKVCARRPSAFWYCIFRNSTEVNSHVSGETWINDQRSQQSRRLSSDVEQDERRARQGQRQTAARRHRGP